MEVSIDKLCGHACSCIYLRKIANNHGEIESTYKNRINYKSKFSGLVRVAV